MYERQPSYTSMTFRNSYDGEDERLPICSADGNYSSPQPAPAAAAATASSKRPHDDEEDSSRSTITCPECGHRIINPNNYSQAIGGGAIHNLPGLPAGVKFDPTDQEILEHLEAKLRPADQQRRKQQLMLHPLIDEFIPTIGGDDGICYTHPEKLPGVGKDGLIRHFFHRPSKAYTTGNRKRRKVQTDEQGCETRWHKTGKTRPVFAGRSGTGRLLGFKKILVLYTNYGKQRKPEKTNWVMHQYHLGNDEEERDGELVVSKVFFQTQPRQCGSGGGGGSAMRPIEHSPVVIGANIGDGIGLREVEATHGVEQHYYMDSSSSMGLIQRLPSHHDLPPPHDIDLMSNFARSANRFEHHP